MLHHYIITTIRNIQKNKVSFFINLIGLSLGLASAFIITSYVLKETSYDEFHSKKDRIYRVLCDATNVGWTSPGVPYLLKEHIDNSIPNVEKSCLVNHMYMAKVKQKNEYVSYRGMYTSTPEFFDIFDCKVISGNLKNSLRKINSVVLTKTTAERFFPNENPVGKIMEVKFDSDTYQLTVEAVIEDFPTNSSFHFTALLNSKITQHYYEALPWGKDFRTSWHFNYNKMFLLLKDHNPELFQTNWDKVEEENNLKEHEVHFHLQPLTNIHLNSENIVNDGPHGSKTYIYLFSSIAFVILLVAAFNYIILSISISKSRYKEIGIKKILGSQNSNIRNQFLTESIILSIMAFPVAYIIAFYSINYLNQLFNISLSINIFNNVNQLLAFLALLILVGLIAGSYVSFYLSRLNPLDIIKSTSVNQKRKFRFQHIMLLFQIIVFTGLVGASSSIYKQIEYIKHADLGINLNNKFTITFRNLKLNHSSYQSLCSLFDNIPEIKNYALGTFMPPENSRGVSSIPDPNDESKKIVVESEGISDNFFDLFNIQCLKGRVFNTKFKNDSDKIVVNEEFVKAFEFDDPVGKMINEKEIIGVIRNFYNHSLHEHVAPVRYSLVKPKYVYDIGIEYQQGMAEESVQKVTKEFTKIFPDAEFEISFISDEIDDLYYKEDNLNKIITYFSLFAIIIALVGIFGQSLFTAKQQVKEIGIRKVNGATNKDILLHVLKKYTLLCLIANAISWPIIYVFIDKWQDTFVYKSPVSIWLILFTLLVSVFVVLGTVASNAWKAAKTNPIEVLKYE